MKWSRRQPEGRYPEYFSGHWSLVKHAGAWWVRYRDEPFYEERYLKGGPLNAMKRWIAERAMNQGGLRRRHLGRPRCKQCNKTLSVIKSTGRFGYAGTNLFCKMRCGHAWAVNRLARKTTGRDA